MCNSLVKILEEDMETLQIVRKSDLARNTRQIIRDVLRGRMAVVENHGQAEVAIVDIVDYRIQRAFINYHVEKPSLSEQDNLSEQEFRQFSDEQELFNRVLAYYLAGIISLARAAELLELTYFDFRTRLLNLGIPLGIGARTMEELESEVDLIKGLK
jgi:predicted HTH domain antitoxin